MPSTKSPRKGSMQFWPRKRARRIVPRIRHWPASDEAKLLGFIGYKVGMTSVLVKDNTPNSITKGKNIVLPVTVVECPPIKILSVRFYKNHYFSKVLVKEIFVDSNKYLRRAFPSIDKMKSTLDDVSEEFLNSVDDVRAVIYSQVYMTGIGKKTPDILEVAIGGKSVQDKFAAVKELVNKPINFKDLFNELSFVDIAAVTKGKGFQGPVKRFGVNIRSHKAEKTKRGPGSLGPWVAQGHIMYRVAHAGQMGFFQRRFYNNLIIHIGEDPEKVNVKGGYLHYGLVKNPYVLIKGSVAGSPKRPVVFTAPMRTHKHKPVNYELKEIRLSSNQ
ncbi:MAG: large subunit ribosomal protein [Candidatus Woesearchaeota archaeon]|nr:large subunit ribosomal protein [Candidatus Woesearchaeota archaeon]MDN5327975.1 large subunit ribosomal protein [Candidatus Woesearchaeota archaeon]